MKHRWIAAVVLALGLAVAACAPPDGGQAGDATPTPSPEPAGSEAEEQGNPDDYGY